ncbi:hypothetical protein FH972_022936 [Carpinus fangiana]|uniref:Cns1/TTC4 wheel domain-containing protein n=1 Tax=Carpinus fangiana TaxID=176857 RepID=A0A5N6KU26_9ROSI|nr:hypothetical protein FH972_022936 [Carpinus fangiana]
MPRIEELPDDFDTSLNLRDAPSPPQPSPAAPQSAAGIPSSMLDQVLPFPDSKLAPASTLPEGAASAAMPPAMANTRAHTSDEVIAMLNRTPLFMTQLDETDGKGGSNTELDALRALAYEGTRAQVADGFRERGNECVAERDWKNARDYYTRALDYLRGVGEEGRKAATNHGQTAVAAADGNGEGVAEPPSLAEKLEGKKGWTRRTKDGKLDGGEGEAQVDWADTRDAPPDWTPEQETALARGVEEKCCTNRALCNLELKNYRQCTLDCAQALLLNPRNVKAYYRSASALLQLDRLTEATDAINFCLSVDPTNAPAETLATKIQTRVEAVAKQEKLRKDREEKKRKELVTLQTAIKARGYAVNMTKNRPADVEDAEISLSDPLDASSELWLPVLLMYPTAAQTDLLKSVSEHDTLLQHLDYILPLPWDEKSEFGRGNAEQVELFADTISGGMVKVGKKVPMRDVLKGGKVVVADGLWRVYVVPKSKVTVWIEEMKKRKGRT